MASESDHEPKEPLVPREPLLKYERVGGHFHAIFKDDSLSCIALHVNYLCVGTYGGNVLLLELNGHFLRRLHQHYKKVHQVCIDETGQYIASCSEDGTVAIYTLCAPTHNNGTPNRTLSMDPSPTPAVPSAPPGGEVTIYNYCQPVYAVAFEDRYAMNREKQFACGGLSGQLVLNKKGWLLDQENTLHEGEGPVHLIRWHAGLVAWANEWGVKVYDAVHDQRVTFIERPPTCPPLELCHCHLEWQSQHVLLVAWAHTLRVVTFHAPASTKPTSPTSLDAMTPSSTGMTAEVVALLTFDFFIAGLSPWGRHNVVAVLAFRPPQSGSMSGPSVSTGPSTRMEGEGESGDMPYPELHVVHLDGKQVSADLLQLKGYQRLRASDYHMPFLRYARSVDDGADPLGTEAAIYDAGAGQVAYVCTPKDVVLCRVRDADDRIQYALARQDAAQALAIALRAPHALRRVRLVDVIEVYLKDVLSQGQYQQAAAEMPRLFPPTGPDEVQLWTKYVYLYAQRGHLSAIARYMPTTTPRLPLAQYEMVLTHFVASDPGQFVDLIRKWPKPRRGDPPGDEAVAPAYHVPLEDGRPLYDAQLWIHHLETVVRRRRMAEADAVDASVDTMYLMEALAELYTAMEQYEEALRIYLSQGHACTKKDVVFQLIAEHRLWPLVATKVRPLMDIDTTLAVHMLVAHLEHWKIHDVVVQLAPEPRLMHVYLHELVLTRWSAYNVEVYAELHEKQVALYAAYAPDFVLKFLQMSQFVPLEKALEYCRTHEPPLWDPMIYLLGRMGQHKKALELILTQREDMTQAVQFVHDHDEGLWEYLIELSLGTKKFVEDLLDFAARDKIDPIKVIGKIPNDMAISNFKQKLLAIIANYRVQERLCRGARKVFHHDRVALLQHQVAARKRGRRVALHQMCAMCHAPLRAPSPGMDSMHVCVFECGHCYHLPCLEDKMRLWKSAHASDASRVYGCFVCDHSTRAAARSSTWTRQLAALTALPARGVSEEQLQRAKDTLLNTTKSSKVGSE